MFGMAAPAGAYYQPELKYQFPENYDKDIKQFNSFNTSENIIKIKTSNSKKKSKKVENLKNNN